jgi:hypothetical protein
MSDLEAAFQDMRSRERLEVTCDVHVSDQHTGRELGRLVNYNEQGIMVTGVTPIEENSVFQLKLVFGDPTAPETIELGVESLWSHSNSDQTWFWTGFYIIDISPESMDRLKILVG